MANTASGNVHTNGYAPSPVDGSPVFYEQKPNAELPILLLDGVGCDGFIWGKVRSALERDFYVLHMHYRGHGRSPLPVEPRDASIATLARDAIGVLDDAGIASAIICGHSMGVQVALEVAKLAPERTSGLALLSGSFEKLLTTFRHTENLADHLPFWQRLTTKLGPWANFVAQSVVPNDIMYEIAARMEIDPNRVSREEFTVYLRSVSRVDVSFFLQMLEEANRHSARDMLSRITAPAWIFTGERDGFTPCAISREMASLIPTAELTVLAEASHTAPVEFPDQLLAGLSRLRDRVRERTGQNPTKNF